MLEVKDIKKTYHMANHDVVALDGVSLNIKPGNLVAIVGPSGCGKTSLMNIMGALDSDFSGDVIINGKSLKEAQDIDVDTYRKNTVGFIFQHFTLINSLNTFENVALAFDISSMNKEEKNRRTNELLTSVGLLEHAKKKVNVLSGGQKQRVAIARALANNPDIILADEPTGALDHKTGIQVMDILKDIAKDRIVIMVTHSPELAEQYANIIVSMEDGKVVSVEDNIPSEKENVEVVETTKSKSKMSLWTAWKLAYRNLKLKKGRTIWTSIGMSIGIIGIALALALTTGTRTTIENQVMSIFPANTISATSTKTNDNTKPKNLNYTDYQNIRKIAKGADGFVFFPQEIMPTVASLNKDNADVMDLRERMTNPDKDDEKNNEDSTIFVANTNVIESYSGKLGFGRLPKKDSPYEVVLSLSTVEELLGADKKAEEALNKDLYMSFTNMQTNENKIVKFKIVGISSENTLLNTMYFNEEFIPTFLKDYFDTDYKDVKSPMIYLFDNSSDNVEKYVASLNKKTDKYTFESVAKSILDTVNIILDGVRNGLVAFSSVSVFVAILMISIVVYISVLERKQEIGIIRAIGGKTKDIRNMFLGESLAIGLLAGTIGVAISYGLCFVINGTIQSLLSSTVSNIPPISVANLEPQVALMLIGICGVLSIISGLIPSIKAARLDPIDAIRKK